MANIKITLTEFLNFVNKSGTAKGTVVKTAKKRREIEDNPYTTDYWYSLRNRIIEFHKKNKDISFIDDIINYISDDKKTNYTALINGYKKFLGKKKIKYITPIRKTWTIGDISIILNPELILEINKKILIIKLFMSAKESMDRKHADLILTLLEHEMRSKVGGDEPIFAVLDVRKGKLFEQNKKESSLYFLLKGEARSFETQWKELEQI